MKLAVCKLNIPDYATKLCAFHLSFISELRERLKPEILDLIKQQRLNYLVEGSRFYSRPGRKGGMSYIYIFALCHGLVTLIIIKITVILQLS